MTAGRVAARDYKDCIPTSVPIPDELHKELKVYCVQHNVTMKEVLFEANIKGIKELLGKE